MVEAEVSFELLRLDGHLREVRQQLAHNKSREDVVEVHQDRAAVADRVD